MYSIEYTVGAIKDMQKLDTVHRKRITLAIDLLAENPHVAQSVKKLRNSPYYRLRVGHYRIIYALERGRMMIIVIHVKKREDAYR